MNISVASARMLRGGEWRLNLPFMKAAYKMTARQCKTVKSNFHEDVKHCYYHIDCSIHICEQ